MKYITFKEETVVQTQIVCSHPQVKKIWETGGYTPINEETTRSIHIILNDGTRHSFSATENYDTIVAEAEEFLSKLPEA